MSISQESRIIMFQCFILVVSPASNPKTNYIAAKKSQNNNNNSNRPTKIPNTQVRGLCLQFRKG